MEWAPESGLESALVALELVLAMAALELAALAEVKAVLV